MGLLYTYFLFGNDNFLEFNLTFGGYSNDKGRWDNHKRDTPEGFEPVEPTYIDVDGFRFVPIAAVELNLTIARGKSWAFKLNNLYAYYISNHSVSMEFTF
jgi:hypothetical protein